MIKESTASAISYGTSAGTVILGLSLNEWAAVAGIVGIFLTWLTNLYFKIRTDRRAERAAREGRLVEQVGSDG